jgi:hypothetical protein
MSPVLRTFLMWLLMLAIPVQGIAASAMLHCGPSHQRQQQAAAAIGGHEDHAHHGDPARQYAHGAHHHGMHAGDGKASVHSAGGADSRGGVDGTHGADATEGAHGTYGADALDGTDSGAAATLSAAKCSACAACCHAAAIIGTPLAVGIAVPGSAPEAAVPLRLEAIVPDGLDRPPRTPSL